MNLCLVNLISKLSFFDESDFIDDNKEIEQIASDIQDEICKYKEFKKESEDLEFAQQVFEILTILDTIRDKCELFEYRMI